MSDVPQDLKYTKSHEWVRTIDDNIVEIGISEHAQELMGDMVFIELPEVGDTIEAGNDCAVVESVKAASDVYAPVSGEVIAINEELADQPELVNQEPFMGGWLFRVRTDSGSSDLLDPAAYQELLNSEA